MTKRRQYSPEFKREAIELTKQPSVSCRQIALEIGVNPTLLSRWKREAEAADDKAFQGSGSPRDEAVAKLKRELRIFAPHERQFSPTVNRGGPPSLNN